VVSVTGVGIDMVVYSTLVLLCRADLKIAIPTSVVIMAFTSVIGLVFKLSTDGMQPGVYEIGCCIGIHCRVAVFVRPRAAPALG